MKKILLLIIIGILFYGVNVKADSETFYEGEYINGEYINKKIDGKTYYMTMQFIRDSKGDIVYCLEPFVSFENGKTYIKYEGDLTGYKDLTIEQKRNIELIVYYGFGYNKRVDNKWYVITQYLIWKEIKPDADIYFTDKLNGTRIKKYEEEMNSILNDVKKHDMKPAFVKDYVVNYNDNLIIEGLNSNYEIVTDYNYELSTNFKVDNIKNDGIIKIKEKANYYKNKVAIYDSTNSQDLIRPGNIENKEYIIKVGVNKGSIILDIRDDNSVYTIESSFRNTCYEIKSSDDVIDKVCTAEEPLVYKTVILPYGEYEVYQTSYGIGYKKDEKIYKVKIDEKNNEPKLILYNQLIKNDLDIIKYACYYDDCIFEEGAVFRITDRDGNIVDDIISGENGYANIVLGYGSYKVAQVKGLDNYTFSSPFEFKIVDEIAEHKKELYNYYIEEEVEVPPQTKVDVSFWDLLVELFSCIFAIFSF